MAQKLDFMKANYICPSSQVEWRDWMKKNHFAEEYIWLIYYRVSTGIPSLTWNQAVDEALCFGWIDSTRKSIDDKRYKQLFTKRKPNSTWSKVNKSKVEYLISTNKITSSGLKAVDLAKRNGTWTLMDDVEDLIIPKDLKNELIKDEKCMNYFISRSNSIQKQMLYWVLSAKRKETRISRIGKIMESARMGRIPNNFK